MYTYAILEATYNYCSPDTCNMHKYVLQGSVSSCENLNFNTAIAWLFLYVRLNTTEATPYLFSYRPL